MAAAVQAHRGGDLAGAERLYRQALAGGNGGFEAWHNLGHVLVQLDRPGEAMRCLNQALLLNPDAPATHNMLGEALRRLDRGEQAAAHYRQALALKPGYAQARHDLGRLLLGLGQVEAAQAEIAAALALSPRRGEYHRSFAEAHRFTEGDPALAAMEALSDEGAALPLVDRIGLSFALGKAYDDLGRRQAAFERYKAGCALVRAHQPYDEAQSLGMHRQMAQLCTAELMAARAGQGYGGAAPIFILGMPRSGSTLVEQVLSRHPAITAGGELAAFRDAASARLGHPSKVSELDAAGLADLGRAYVRTVAARRPGAVRVTDKMPGNFLLLGLIRLALPQARFIHTVRDPVDTCLSCFTTVFDGGHAYSYDLGELGRYHRSYQRLMDHWRTVLPPGVMIDVAYEDVVGDMEGQSRRILAHCGLDWDPACLDFSRPGGGVWTASAGQVRQPLYRSSVGRWRPSEAVLRPLLDALSAD